MSSLISIAPSFPCQSVYKIANLLSPVTKYSLISSSLWNEIVQDLYLTYSVFKYINYLSQYPYPEYIQPAIDEFLNFPYQFTPYQFTPLLVAQKGIPLTVDEFNKLIDAIIELANEFDINLKTQLSHVQHDQIVKSSQFSNVIYAINQLLTFNFNTYFLLSCSGYEFSNLLNTQNTFLNVLIGILNIDITISDNTYVKNLLIYNSNRSINIYGSIGTIVMETNNGGIFLYNYGSVETININQEKKGIFLNDNSYINSINIGTDNGGIFLDNYTYINSVKIGTESIGVYLDNYSVVYTLNIGTDSGGIYLENYTYINSVNIGTEGFGVYLDNYSVLYTLNIGTDNGGVYLDNYTSVNTITIQTENAGVYLNNNAYVNILYVENNVRGVYLNNDTYINTLYVENNVGGIYLNDNSIIENLICKQNSGGVYIFGNAKIINNQCI